MLLAGDPRSSSGLVGASASSGVGGCSSLVVGGCGDSEDPAMEDPIDEDDDLEEKLSLSLEKDLTRFASSPASRGGGEM